MENQVRTIVADMLLNLSEKMSLMHRDLKGQAQEMQSINIKIHETNTKLDREAKIKDQVDGLKQKISAMEKGMLSDIENAVKNHDEVIH